MESGALKLVLWRSSVHQDTWHCGSKTERLDHNADEGGSVEGRGSISSRPKRREKEHKDEDHLYCEDCKSFYTGECKVHGPPNFIPDSPAPVGVPGRAKLTLPPGLAVRQSNIPNAGLGVFNQDQEIPRGTHFGPYEGEKYNYADDKKDTHSNWMRYVNCAESGEEQNLVGFQYRGRILYRCCKPIAPGEELLVWYGEDDARDHSISFNPLGKSQRRPKETTSSSVFPCSLCLYSFTAQIHLHKHIKRSHTDEYLRLLKSGEIRSETFTSSHKDSGAPSKREFTRPSSKQSVSHLKKSHLCDQCGRSFNGPEDLRRHQRTHSGERPFICSQCGKSFSVQFSLTVHQRRHSGDRPHRCTHCTKAFNTEADLRRHQRIHTGERPYRCLQCGRGFTQDGHLRLHLRTHSGERPYLCSRCDLTFTEEGSFKRHMRTHTGRRPYRCPVCRERFTRRESVQVHLRIHTGEKPYYCVTCGKSFIQSGDFIKHQRTHAVS